MATTDLLTRARAGDGEAFARLVDPHRRELQVHCYRILASTQDAEDALQETLLAAWQGLAGFEGRASIRTWLYRIATTRCLNALRSGSRRPRSVEVPQVPPSPRPDPTRLGEVLWLEPYPDTLLDGLIDVAAGPEARYESREAISLAFVTAVQALPPRQRAVLILRDVLGFGAREVAQLLDSTQESVTSALKRARATMRAQPGARHLSTRDPNPIGEESAARPGTPPAPGSATERQLVSDLTRAFENADIDGLVALLADDILLTMPPIPMEYQGRELVARFYSMVVFRPGRRQRLVPTRANGQPAVGIYVGNPHSPILHANGLMVLTLDGAGRISVMTRFDNSVISRFALPRLLSI